MVTCRPMRETEEEITSWFNSTAVPVEKYFLFSSLALIFLFAWMEPAGAAGIGFWKGLVFWTIQIAILMPLLITVQHVASHHIRLKTHHTPWIQTVLSGVAAAILFVPIAYCLDFVFSFPEESPSVGILKGLVDEATGVVIPVTLTWVALNAPWIFQLDFSRKQPNVTLEERDPTPGTTPSETVQPTRFMQELRNRSLGELISISSELHYLRVVTTDSEVMFLYNLKDALEELPPEAGVHIHRSHWVARGHVKELKKRNGSSECILSNGKRLPVSRRKFAEVRDLLERQRL